MGLLTNGMRTCAQKVPLVENWINCMSGKALHWEIVNFRILLLVLVQLAYLTITTALTSMQLGREMKLCDPTNNVKFESM